MLFNSFQFILFLPCVIILYYILPNKLRWVLLLAASYYFYMVWKPEYILLIVISTLVDYFASIFMEKQKVKAKRKAFLFLSLFINLGLLFTFKYFNFFNGELGKFYSAMSGNNYPIGALNVILPMGISFYTFQTLSYTIDVYRGKRKAERHLGYFALYVTYFPQLVAGPIERSDRLLPQLKKKSEFDIEIFMSSLLRICWGMFKKVMIADRIAIVVNKIYGNVEGYSSAHLVIATIFFAIQIYCDFSAYSDIAIGSAKMMGVDLMENFKVPYLSKSISEFWSRWHISLSTWFKDYLYIPLGGNRMDRVWKNYMNLIIVFVVSGFWHGANWTFIIWGLLHGTYQIIERLLAKIKFEKFKMPEVIKLAVTFALVMFAWIFFRADNIGDAIYVAKNIGISGVDTVVLGENSIFNIFEFRREANMLYISCLVLFVTDWFRYRFDRATLTKGYLLTGIVCIVLAVITIVCGHYGSDVPAEFIYFQF